MIGNRDQLATFKVDFYQVHFHKMLRGLSWLLILMILLIAGIIYLILFKPLPNYYGSTTKGQIISMPPAFQK